MKRFALLAAATIATCAGVASAQTVTGLGLQGQDAASGIAPKQLVVMFHGYTQNGLAMKPLADDLAKRLPDAAFVYIDGPAAAKTGKSWYDFQGDNKDSTMAAAKALAVKTVKDAQTALKVSPANTVVIGFSQGGGVALDAGICSTPDVKAVVSLAGVLESTCPKEATGAPASILIVRNDGDQTVKEDRIVAFEDAVKAAGYTSTRKTVTGATHWPAPEGIKIAEDFIVAQLGGK
jgi:phospholipase/carboxylesterase